MKSKLTELIGYAGSLLLGLCALPEVYISLTTGTTGLSWSFLLMWYFGEILLMIYTIIKNKQVKLLPLIGNYGLNIVFISIILWVKLGV